MIGSTIKVTATAENGNTFESDETAPVDDGVYTFDITSARASKVNEIEVTFADAVEAENVTFAVTKGTETIAIEAVTADNWSLDEKEVTLKTSANMIKGTYTVTATDTETEDEASAEFEVLDKQTVAEIVIMNDKAYTNADDDNDKAHKEAYAYYDVKDQYGESIRSSASIQWSGSCEIKADKANGMLTLKKSDDKAWVYGEQIYITGVHTKNGVAKSATLTVGTEQALNSIEIVGFLKKGTSEIVEDLPKDFKEGEYYMLFHALDQNDCPLKADKIGREDVTFTTPDVTIVKELTFGEKDAADATDNKGFTVKGEEYNAVYVNPGIQVSTGGEVTITAIANKTGKKTDYNFWVGPDAVVDSFTISSPSGVVADGDQGVDIPFTALDKDGQPITNFRQLAKQEIFNTLSFNTSEGTLVLAEQDDRTAKLTWSDEEKYAETIDGVSPWSYAVTTDDIDRPVSLTVVVVGGAPDHEMLYVQDKRRPNAISAINLKDVYVEGDDIDITEETFKFYDQYSSEMSSDWGDDDGFFKAATDGVLKGLDFSGYDFGIRVEYAGTGKIEKDDVTTTTTYVADPDGKRAVIDYNDIAAYDTATTIKSVATGEGFKFDIVKFKPATGLNKLNPNDWESVSPSKYHGLTVVDITQVKNFKVGDLNTFYTGKLNITGDKIIDKDSLANLKDSAYDTPATAAGAEGEFGIQQAGDYRQEIKVTGTYNESSVTIPHDYYTVATTKGSLEDNDHDAKDAFDTVGAISLRSLYDATTANGNAKLGEDEVVATIVKLYTELGWWKWDADGGDFAIDEEITQAQALATFTDTVRSTGMLAAANEVMDEAGETDLTQEQLTALLANTEVPSSEVAEQAATAAATALGNAETAEAEAKAEITVEGNREKADDIWAGLATKTEAAVNAANYDALEAGTGEHDKPSEIAAAKAYLLKKIDTANAQDAKNAADALVVSAEAKEAAEAFAQEFDEKKALTAAGQQSTGEGDKYDTAKAPITYSDQKPYAAGITGLKDSYTFNPTFTVINDDPTIVDIDAVLDINLAAIQADLEVVDQYGVDINADLQYTVSNAVEDKDGYAENNFKVTGNTTADPVIEGAEIGDTFDLVVSVQGETLSKTTKVTVGADLMASIVNDTNNYTKDGGLKDVLEAQRKAGLQ